MKKNLSTLLSILFLLLASILIYFFDLPVDSFIDDESTKSENYEVVGVTDGDTIKVQVNENIETVRIVNMNTPESVDPRKPVECLGKEASELMKELVLGKVVTLEIDETQTDKDRYNRLLRFVFLEDGADVGLEMIKLGYAHSTPYGNSPHKYLDLYESFEQEAKDNQLGLWNPEVCKTSSN